MVLANFDEEKYEIRNYAQDKKNPRHLAYPLDRLAAQIVDFAIILMFSGLLSAPFQKNFELAKILDQVWEAVFWFAAIILVFFICHIFYHTICIRVWEQTLGKKLFSLKVVSIWKRKISWKNSFMRVLIWWFEVLCLGIPFLAVFTNLKRRPFHERMSDTICFSYSHRIVGPPSLNEKSFVKGLMIPFYLGALLIFSINISTIVNFWLENREKLNDYQANIPRCEEVIEATADWPKYNGVKATRLEVAMGLYSAELVDKDCLLSEAQSAFYYKREQTLAYLASAFAHENNSELSNEYLMKVCKSKENSNECLFARIVNFWAEKDWVKAEEALSKVIMNDKTYIKNWAIKHYMSRRQHEKAYEILSDLQNNEYLSNFLASIRTQLLWSLGREEEALVSFNSSIPSLSKTYKRKTHAWLCLKQLNRSCESAKSDFCSDISEWNKHPKQVSLEEYFAQLRYFECNSQGNLKTVAQLLRGQKNELGERAFHSIVRGESSMQDLVNKSYKFVPSLFTSELVRRLVETSNTNENIKSLEKFWRKTNPYTKEWEDIGYFFVDKYKKDRKFNDAIAVLNSMYQITPNSNMIRKNLIVLNYLEGNKKRAWDFFNKDERSPASVKVDSANYNNIIFQLKKEFLKK